MGRSSRSAGSTPQLLEFIPEKVRHGTRTFLVRLVLTLAVVTILCSWFVILRSYVAHLDCYQVDARTLRPTVLPSWAGPAVRDELSVLPGIPSRFSIMSPGICERVAAAFERNPWVDEVLSVRKVYPRRILVELRLRRPVAGVLVGEKYYLVDAAAHRLTPPLDRWPKGPDTLPVLIVSTNLVPSPGKEWTSEDVKAGACVARTLLENREKLQTRFAAIDVTNIGGCRSALTSDILLITDKGTVVKWGRSPLLVNSPGELTPGEKIIKMILFEEKRGPLSSYRYVDIRFDNAQHGPRIDSVASRGLSN